MASAFMISALALALGPFMVSITIKMAVKKGKVIAIMGISASDMAKRLPGFAYNGNSLISEKIPIPKPYKNKLI
jgi:hypothetical protein